MSGINVPHTTIEKLTANPRPVKVAKIFFLFIISFKYIPPFYGSVSPIWYSIATCAWEKTIKTGRFAQKSPYLFG
jgi:hypothetical protein